MVIGWLGENLWTAAVLVIVALTHLAESYVINAIVPVTPRTIPCWRCENKTDNSQCNHWTREHNCPTNYSVCQTIHRREMSSGRTLQLSKRCALAAECTTAVIGCHDTHINGIQDCISCCNYAYCNEIVPSNYSTALSYTIVQSAAPSLTAAHSGGLHCGILTAIVVGFTVRQRLRTWNSAWFNSCR